MSFEKIKVLKLKTFRLYFQNFSTLLEYYCANSLVKFSIGNPVSEVLSTLAATTCFLREEVLGLEIF